MAVKVKIIQGNDVVELATAVEDFLTDNTIADTNVKSVDIKDIRGFTTATVVYVEA